MFIVRVVVSIFLQKTISSTLFHKYLAGGSHVETFSGIESNGGGDERESDGSYDRQEDGWAESRDRGAVNRGFLLPQPLSGDDTTSISFVISFKLIHQFLCLHMFPFCGSGAMVYVSPCLCLYLQHTQGRFLLCTIMNEIPVLKKGLPQVEKQPTPI